MPESLAGFSPLYVENLFLLAVRTIAMLMTVPVFSSRSVPAIAKVGLGVLLAVVLLPMGASLGEIPPSLGLFLIAVGRELLVGLLAGFAATLVFAAVQFAASLTGLQVGLSMASTLDPASAQQGSVIDHLYLMLASLLFLGTNGHHLLLLGFQRLLDAIPLNSFSPGLVTSDRLATLFGNVFVAGVQIATPAIGALFLADVALAIVARTAPQINVFFVGMPLKLALGIFTIFITLPVFTVQAERLFGSIVSDINLLLRAN
jgi:flagellar biosynthetic protein FliR